MQKVPEYHYLFDLKGVCPVAKVKTCAGLVSCPLLTICRIASLIASRVFTDSRSVTAGQISRIQLPTVVAGNARSNYEAASTFIYGGTESYHSWLRYDSLCQSH
jgi:hypothetical protein